MAEHQAVPLYATTALPYHDSDRAAAGLRGQLRLLAIENGRLLDWETLIMEGPTMTRDMLGRTWFEWSATVEAEPR